MSLKLSIVTGTRNRPKSYRRFLESVFCAPTTDFEVVVVDASDGGKSYTDIDDGWDTIVNVIPEKPRLGPIRGYNLGFKAARGEYVAFFNDDCELLPGWDETAIAFMDRNPQVGIGIIYFKDHFGDWNTNGEPQPDASRFGPLYITQSLFNVVYANFGIVRRECGEQIGWQDEDALGFMYGGDTDLCFEAIWRGWQVVTIPDCRVLHWRQRDRERQDTRSLCKNDRAKFDAKWVPRLPELRDKQNKFMHLVGPRTIGKPQ